MNRSETKQYSAIMGITIGPKGSVHCCSIDGSDVFLCNMPLRPDNREDYLGYVEGILRTRLLKHGPNILVAIESSDTEATYPTLTLLNPAHVVVSIARSLGFKTILISPEEYRDYWRKVENERTEASLLASYVRQKVLTGRIEP